MPPKKTAVPKPEEAVAPAVEEVVSEPLIAKKLKNKAIVEKILSKRFGDGYSHPNPAPIKTEEFPPHEASFKPTMWFNNN
jgi:hypothetical protein